MALASGLGWEDGVPGAEVDLQQLEHERRGLVLADLTPGVPLWP